LGPTVIQHLAVPFVAGAAVIGLFLLLVARRWFAQFSRGFFWAVAVAIGSVALFAAALTASWGYEAARRILASELSVSLGSVADLVQRQIDLEVQRATEHLTGLSDEAAAGLAPGGNLPDLSRSFRAVLKFTPHYLAIDAIDATGRVAASSELSGQRLEPDRIGTAFNLDGKNFVSEPRRSADYKGVTLYVSVPVRNSRQEVVGALGTVIDLQSVLEDVVRAARFNQSGYVWIVGGAGRVLAHPDTSHLGQDVSKHPVVVAGQTQASGEMTALNLDNQLRRYFFRQVRNPQTVGGKPWVLLTAIDEREALAPLASLRNELIAAIGVIIIVGVIVAWRVSLSLTRPMYAMVDVAQAIHGGDLTRRTGLKGRDSIGRLGIAMDEMAKGLQERDRVKDVFGRYIAKQAAEQLLKGPLDLGGEAKRVTILFSDIRGFTSMAETMAPAEVVRFLNAYFSEMVDAVMEQEGMLDKFLGDGLMAVFGSFGDQPDHARRAVLAALRMKALLAKLNGERAMAGQPPVAIGIGIHTDEVIVGSIGSKQRLEFTHIGDGVNTASRVQALNKEYQTTILITGATFEALNGEFEAKPIAEVTLRGKTRSLPIYEVISSATASSAVTAGV
jgi:class 3 adenylate cyclase